MSVQQPDQPADGTSVNENDRQYLAFNPNPLEGPVTLVLSTILDPVSTPANE
jgi:hypothetical protein|tara:strand:- start:150 stop:305 length:156 start_codon:yes stop_codon:yes gene_type:complete